MRSEHLGDLLAVNRRDARRDRFWRWVLRVSIVGNFVSTVLFVAIGAAILSKAC